MSLSSLSGCDTRVPTISIAEIHLDKDMFIYTAGLSCSWHENMETYLRTVEWERFGYLEQLSTDM